MTTKTALPERKKHINPMDRQGPGDKVISVITYIVYAFFAFVCAYPFYYIIINSISANNLSERGKVLFYPMEIHFKNYERMANIPGLHYRVTNDIWKQIPNLNGIPQYYLYDREGKLVWQHEGWSDERLKTVEEEIEKAMR